MTYFLRDKQGNSLYDLDVWEKTYDDGARYFDMQGGVCWEESAQMLLQLKNYEQQRFIQDLASIDEIRGAWWEGPDGIEFNPDKDIHEFVMEMLTPISIRWGLAIVTD